MSTPAGAHPGRIGNWSGTRNGSGTRPDAAGETVADSVGTGEGVVCRVGSAPPMHAAAVSVADSREDDRTEPGAGTHAALMLPGNGRASRNLWGSAILRAANR